MIPVVLHEARPLNPKPGDAWHVDNLDDWEIEHEVADRHKGKRPLFVKLPNGSEFCVYSPVINAGKPQPGSGWTVTGEAPNITLSPSVNIVGRWHGFIENGMIRTC